MEKENKNEEKQKKEKEKNKQMKLYAIICVIIIFLPAVIIGVVILKNNIDEKNRIAAEEARLAAQIEVPNVNGMTLKEAEEILNNVGLKVKISDYDKRVTEEKPDEYVVSEYFPGFGKKVDPNTEVELFFEKLMIVKSSNYYGMRFNKTIEEFCEDYNKNIEKAYDYLEESKTTIELDKLKKSDFSYYMTVEATKCKEYVANKIGYSVMIFTEPDSDYIVYACVGYDKNKVANSDKMLTFLLQKIYPATAMSLLKKSYSGVIDDMQELLKYAENNNHICILFKNNAVYHFTDNGSLDYHYLYAMSEEKYKELMSKNNQTSSNNQAIISDIQQRLDFFNSYYKYGFTPTEEQMNEMVEYYKQNKDSFNNDMLKDYIKQKGWLNARTGLSEMEIQQDRTGGIIEQENTSNISTTKSNKSSSNNNNNISTPKEDVEATLNINLDALIAKNATAKEIKEKSQRIDIHISVEDSLVSKDYFEYFGGGSDIPSIITTVAKLEEGYNYYDKKNAKDRTEKRKVTITMDNTATEIIRTTLFEGEMAFPNTGTYEIK